jgi:hypothetical protein
MATKKTANKKTIGLKLGTLIDRLYKAQQHIAEAAREVARAERVVQQRKHKAAGIETEIRNRFKRGTLEGAEGKIARVSLKKVVGPQLKNWDKLAAFVLKNKAPELFQRRISKQAWLDWLDERNQRPIPGILKYEEIRLSVTKKG